MHHLKACGFPPIQFPEAFTYQQLTRLQGKVEGMVEAMVVWQGPRMGGFRLEARVKPNGCSWGIFEQQVSSLVACNLQDQVVKLQFF